MSVDYDLIVVGAASVGRYAALSASQQGARVALVVPPATEPRSALLLHHLMQINSALRQQVWLTQFSEADGLATSESATNRLAADTASWSKLRQWVDALSEMQAISTSSDSLVKLAAAGVEVIEAAAMFEQRPVYRRLRLGLAVAGRWLRAPAYLLTPTLQAAVPPIDGLAATEFVTLDGLWQQPWQPLPPRVVILGVDPRGIALAQVLNRLGVQVTLITSSKLLPQHDPDLCAMLQAYLEAEGVTVLTQTQVRQVTQGERRINVQTGSQTFETDVIVLAMAPELNLAQLNLSAAKVKWQPDRIVVNHKLQTSNPRIYACGDCLGGLSSVGLDRYEADVALFNALFLPLKQVNYLHVPLAVFTDPQVVSIGLSESRARALYGAEVLVVKQSYKSLLKAQIRDDTTGFLKLIAHRNGSILGAHCFGSEASEWISTITLAMQRQLKLDALTQLPLLSPTLAELMQQTAAELQQQHRQRDLLETWFNFRRGR
jgi:pyruvate/2-oxoglutarate dehydrogenase complex dihydrolipoamide dehydrogenase (E3) component